jgi:hypothetical protein
LANDEGGRLLRIVRRCSGSVVTWRRAQMVLLSAQGMGIAWRNRHKDNEALRDISIRAKAA